MENLFISLALLLIVQYVSCHCKCPEHEKYIENGNACFNTCQHPIRLFYCEAGLKSGCYCVEGRIWDEQSQCCVLPKDCPKNVTCQENEFFNPQGYKCVPSCDFQVKFKCVADTVSGCYCREGYLREGISEKCIRKEDCPS